MLKKLRQKNSIRESVIFCLLSGVFIYGICSIPCLMLHFFPPKNDSGITFSMACLQPPNKHALIISFGLLAIIGIWFLRKVNFQSRIVHFLVLSLVLAIGGGFLTGVLETAYLVFISNNLNQEPYIISLDKYYGFAPSIVWVIAFTLIQIPFVAIFLVIKALINRFSILNSLK